MSRPPKTGGPKPKMGAPRKKQKKDRAAAGPAVDLAETEIDNWGWRRVKLPAATDAADEDMGGLYMLEEIDDVDIEYRANEAGPGKAVRFKKIGKGRPGKTKSQSDDPAEDDLIANANFIDIDDFKEEDAKALRGKKGSKGSKTDAAQQGVAAEAKPSSKGKRKREGKEVSDDDEEEQDEEAESVGSSDPHDAEDIEEADDDEVKGADEDEIEDADEGEESESEDGSDDDETGGEISQESKVALEAWAPFNLSSRLLRGLSDRGFMSPTPIQSRCLPVAIQWKRDIVGTAETGSGKTLAFGLPILDYLARLDRSSLDGQTSGLILTPTRELAIQIAEHLKNVSKHVRAKIAVVVGGMSIQKQERQLGRIPDIVVATPGRLWEIMSASDSVYKLLGGIKFLVLDEADRMLEFGHFQELSSILKAISLRQSRPEAAGDEKVLGRQTFVFSATLAKADFVNKNKAKAGKTMEKGLSMRDLLKKIEFQDEKPIRIDLTKATLVATGLKEFQIRSLPKAKDAYLYHSLLSFPGRTLVFVASIDSVTRLITWLKLLGIPCFPLHGKLQQRQRLKNLDRFKSSDRAVLVATDVAARGLDIPQVQHVVHYHVARNAQTYVHRSGRTARAGKEGVSVSLIAPEEIKSFDAICRTTKKVSMGELPVDRLRLAELQKRVDLAVAIEKAEHKLRHDSSSKSWAQKLADEMDIELDDKL